MSFTDMEACCKPQIGGLTPPKKKKHVTDFWVDLAMAFPLADEVLNLAKATLGGIPPKSWGNHHSCPWRNPHRFFVEHVIKKAKLA